MTEEHGSGIGVYLSEGPSPLHSSAGSFLFSLPVLLPVTQQDLYTTPFLRPSTFLCHSDFLRHSAFLRRSAFQRVPTLRLGGQSGFSCFEEGQRFLNFTRVCLIFLSSIASNPVRSLQDAYPLKNDSIESVLVRRMFLRRY